MTELTQYTLYFLFVAAAIGGLAILVKRLGMGGDASYSIDEAQDLLRRAHPTEVPGEARVAAGTVLFSLDGDRIAIVRPMGRFPLVRVLAGDELMGIREVTGGLKLRIADYTDPQIRLTAEDPAEDKAWLEQNLGRGL